MEISGGNQFIKISDVLSIANLSEGDSVGYLGCGAKGYFTIPFAQKIGQTGKLYAVDILSSALDSTMREARRQNLGNIVPLIANLEIVGGVKIPPHSLDVALLINVLFQNKQHDNMFREADRLLKKNGRLVIIDWAFQGNLRFGPASDLRVNPDQLDRQVSALGFERIWSGKVGDFHTGWVYKKK